VLNDGIRVENNYLAVYGILKRGFPLDLTHYGGRFVETGRIKGANLYSIGREQKGVGLRFTDDPLCEVHVEVFKIVEDETWEWLDEIESNGYSYTRKIIRVNPTDLDGYGKDHPGFDCWVYEHTYPGMKYTSENLIEGGKF
jgi:gamma-glutamylcyclotransferase (GGCT)/AIG2-like uncharacterized protein YtfP